MFLDFLCFLSPAILLAMIAQYWVRSSYARSMQEPAKMSGFAAARQILDSAGLTQVEIQQSPGFLSDHYDPRQRVLRLSSEVYHSRSMAAVGIAAHEAGHALQHAQGYLPLKVRTAAVPAASFGSSTGLLLMVLGSLLQFPPILLFGIATFLAVVFFQVINLPVEFNASSRAKAELTNLGIVSPQEMPLVNRVLRAAALTYVATTLQTVFILLYGLQRYSSNR